MDDLILIDKLKKRINATVQQIGDSMMTGGVDSMEKYKQTFCKKNTNFDCWRTACQSHG